MASHVRFATTKDPLVIALNGKECSRIQLRRVPINTFAGEDSPIQ